MPRSQAPRVGPRARSASRRARQAKDDHMPLNWNFPAKIGPKTGRQVLVQRAIRAVGRGRIMKSNGQDSQQTMTLLLRRTIPLMQMTANLIDSDVAAPTSHQTTDLGVFGTGRRPHLAEVLCRNWKHRDPGLLSDWRDAHRHRILVRRVERSRANDG